jgi:hypothetical protein
MHAAASLHPFLDEFALLDGPHAEHRDRKSMERIGEAPCPA